MLIKSTPWKLFDLQIKPCWCFTFIPQYTRNKESTCLPPWDLDRSLIFYGEMCFSFSAVHSEWCDQGHSVVFLLYCRLSEMIIFSCTVDIRKAMDVFMLYKTSSNNHPLVIYFKWITPATHTENCLILTTQKLSVLEVLSTIDRLTAHLAHIYVHVDTNSTHTPIKHSQILNWSVDSEIQGRQVEAE